MDRETVNAWIGRHDLRVDVASAAPLDCMPATLNHVTKVHSAAPPSATVALGLFPPFAAAVRSLADILPFNVAGASRHDATVQLWASDDQGLW